MRGKLTKVYQPVGIVLKGPGFYKTDSRNGKKSTSTSERSDSSSDSGSKSDSKSDTSRVEIAGFEIAGFEVVRLQEAGQQAGWSKGREGQAQPRIEARLTASERPRASP